MSKLLHFKQRPNCIEAGGGGYNTCVPGSVFIIVQQYMRWRWNMY